MYINQIVNRTYNYEKTQYSIQLIIATQYNILFMSELKKYKIIKQKWMINILLFFLNLDLYIVNKPLGQY